ncbi:uncharacterized protein LOC119531050 [Choloepus didactylus]|uniref:uncharacterized protein LOC119531050 n=1 Tax=Choloepus didactylus TaxID=27675 RepID=UPI00189FDE21|nr:uncharacterized protein LOC119531050 [Choloepus didactylus]
MCAPPCPLSRQPQMWSVSEKQTWEAWGSSLQRGLAGAWRREAPSLPLGIIPLRQLRALLARHIIHHTPRRSAENVKTAIFALLTGASPSRGPGGRGVAGSRPSGATQCRLAPSVRPVQLCRGCPCGSRERLVGDRACVSGCICVTSCICWPLATGLGRQGRRLDMQCDTGRSWAGAWWDFYLMDAGLLVIGAPCGWASQHLAPSTPGPACAGSQMPESRRHGRRESSEEAVGSRQRVLVRRRGWAWGWGGRHTGLGMGASGQWA